MNNDEIQQTLDAHQQLIRALAKGCLNRLRKPSVFDLEDIIQEGRLACVNGLRHFDQTKSSVSAYIYFCLMTQFTDMIRTSWRRMRDSSNYALNARIRKSVDPANIAAVHEFQETLTKEEANFVSLNFDHPTQVSICRTMGITDYFRKKIQERLIRKTSRSL